jgi:hypothetical protein
MKFINRVILGASFVLVLGIVLTMFNIPFQAILSILALTVMSIFLFLGVFFAFSKGRLWALIYLLSSSMTVYFLFYLMTWPQPFTPILSTVVGSILLFLFWRQSGAGVKRTWQQHYAIVGIALATMLMLVPNSTFYHWKVISRIPTNLPEARSIRSQCEYGHLLLNDGKREEAAAVYNRISKFKMLEGDVLDERGLPIQASQVNQLITDLGDRLQK